MSAGAGAIEGRSTTSTAAVIRIEWGNGPNAPSELRSKYLENAFASLGVPAN
jgi:hypothetical protein